MVRQNTVAASKLFSGPGKGKGWNPESQLLPFKDVPAVMHFFQLDFCGVSTKNVAHGLSYLEHMVPSLWCCLA